MAVLSTVIGRGLASAKPGSPAAGYIYFSTDTAILERYSGSAWAPISGSPVAYLFATSTADGDPGTATIRYNNATPASVTVIYIDDVALGSSADFSTMYANLVGANILLHSLIDDANFLLATVSAVEDGTGYYKLTVTIDDSGTLPAAGEALEMHVFSGGGGGSSLNWWDYIRGGQVVGIMPMHDGILNNGLGNLPALIGGSADVSGVTGTGGNTELTVKCSCVYDTTASANNAVGYNMGNPDTQMGVGMYFRGIVRFPTPTDQDLYVGLRSAYFTNGTETSSSAVGFLKRAAGTNWQAHHSTAGAAATDADSGVAFSSSAWNILECYVYDNGGTMTAKFWIDGTLVHTATTNMPASTTRDPLYMTITTTFITGGDTTTYDNILFINDMVWMVENKGLSALSFATL
jgi:hypothetical protein